VVEAGPRALVDQEVVPARAAFGRCVLRNPLQECRITFPDLFQEQLVHHLRRFHDVLQRSRLGGRQRVN